MEELDELIQKGNECLRLAECHIHQDHEAYKRYLGLAMAYTNLADQLLKFKQFKFDQHERT